MSALRAIAAARLAAQGIARPSHRTPREVVRHLLALQAQDHPGALWSVALRTPTCTRADVERAIEAAELVRTWPMRGTLHLVAAEDVRWLLALLAPRASKKAEGRRRELGLDAAVLRRAERVVLREVEAHGRATRKALFAALDAAGIASAAQRGVHILSFLCHQGLLCFGPHAGKEPTFVALDAWVPPAPPRPRDEALAELARRYVAGHGPATVRDLAGWAGLGLTEAREAVGLAGAAITAVSREGEVYLQAPDAPAPARPPSAHLLPGFDEYLLGYKDRRAALAPELAQRIVPGGNGMFLPTLVVDGQVVGTWRRREKRSGVELQLAPFRPLSAAEQGRLDRAAERFRRFVTGA